MEIDTQKNKKSSFLASWTTYGFLACPCCLVFFVFFFFILGTGTYFTGIWSKGEITSGSGTWTPSPSGPHDDDCGEKIVKEAKKWIGKVSYGGCNMPNNADCSCFTQYVIQKVFGNIGMPRLANQQADPNLYKTNKPAIVVGPIGPGIPDSYYDAKCTPHSKYDLGPIKFTKTNIKSLEKGDLIFYNTPTTNKGCNGITHIGIYDGNKIIHSGSSSGVASALLIMYKFYGAVSFCRAGGENKKSLQELIDAKVAEWKKKNIGQVGILIKGNQEDEKAIYSDTNKYLAASVIKVYVAATALKQTEQGKFSTASIQNDLHSMLNQSDNNATNRLIDKVGGFEPINNTIKEMGLSGNSIIQRKMAQPDINKENYTTPADINKTFEMLNSGTYLSASSRNLMKEYMTNCAADEENALAKVKAKGAVVTHKIGSLDKPTYGYWVDNDVGIINYKDTTIYISVFSQFNYIDGFAKQDQFIAEIAETVIDYLDRKK